MAFPGKTVCPIYEQPRQAIEFLFGSGVFSIATALDRFPPHAQDRSLYKQNATNRTDVNDRHRPDCVSMHLYQLRRSTV